MVEIRNKILTCATHAYLLKRLFPKGKVISTDPTLVWECGFRPTPLSNEYTIQLDYTLQSQPKIYVIGTKLEIGKAVELPHVHSTEEQRLCLHYPPERKWTAELNIAATIIPWAAEWLFHYEIWLQTDEWNGGGTVH